METTIVYWDYIGDNGEENGNYHSILGWDGFRVEGFGGFRV